MTTTTARPWHARPALLLAAGGLLLFLAHLRFGVGALAWVAPVPLLRFLRVTPGWRARLALVGLVAAAWIAACLKITTAPLPPVFALPVGLGVGLMAALGYLGWDALRRRAGATAAILAFPACAVVAEWLQVRFTPLSSWGAAAYTQLGDLPLLQVASLLGMAGVSFLVQWAAAWLEAAFSSAVDGRPVPWRHGVAVGVALLAAHGFGAARLASAVPGEPVRVAAVGTTATFGGFPIPAPDERQRILKALLHDSGRAADAGAQLIVWTEAATVVEAGEEEQTLQMKAFELALHHQVEVVIAYIVPRSEQPPSFENKLVWASPDGLRLTYLKHRPAPGEPAVVGTGPLEAIETGWGRAGGALCYDYDDPSLAREHARAGVGLVALPSSDWRGIDPIHTEMAALRAIEGGFSLVRSTRFGLSGAIDPYGRLVARRSSFDGGDRVLLAYLPAQAVPTLATRVGDGLVFACLAGIAVMVAVGARRGRAGQEAQEAGVG